MGVMTVATTPSATRAEAMLRAAGGLGAGGWADAAELGAACAMEHRGGCLGDTGDGAGLLFRPERATFERFLPPGRMTAAAFGACLAPAYG